MWKSSETSPFVKQILTYVTTEYHRKDIIIRRKTCNLWGSANLPTASSDRRLLRGGVRHRRHPSTLHCDKMLGKAASEWRYVWTKRHTYIHTYIWYAWVGMLYCLVLYYMSLCCMVECRVLYVYWRIVCIVLSGTILLFYCTVRYCICICLHWVRVHVMSCLHAYMYVCRYVWMYACVDAGAYIISNACMHAVMYESL